MKKICVKAATAAFCLAACGIGANVYAASTATVDFHGKIYMPTCDVTTDQPGNSVDLGKYSSDYFTAEGKDTVAKDFNVKRNHIYNVNLDITKLPESTN